MEAVSACTADLREAGRVTGKLAFIAGEGDTATVSDSELGEPPAKKR